MNATNDQNRSARKALRLAASVAVLALIAVACTSNGASPASVDPQPAPDYAPALDWLNTAQPLTLDELSGKIVLT